MTSDPDPYDELGDLYDEWVVSVVEDIPFYVGLATHVAGLFGRDSIDVVELGAGSGRISLPLALRGHRVRAIDTAPGQLRRLAAAAGTAGVADLVEPIEGDMRKLGALCARDSAHLVIAPFRSLLHVADDRATVLGAVREVLLPGGLCAFDVFHPTPTDSTELGNRWVLRRRVSGGPGVSWSIWEHAAFAPDGSGLDLSVRADPHGSAEPQRLARMHLATPRPHEWHSALLASGLEVESAYGWFDESPLDLATASDSVWVARRP